ncbi:hypothetical protein OJF2_54430 [Aquisphaera giovannonii]|uniref:Uncharacterized protein n=1 Tax=Aquisphaera giovannonii TaxID=406548 RepID=A0A5B9W8C4_9BACT|nr:hypothetical protein [Aquisphaera giovannonii]QEH36858.1 hypothetical protein OJF2_54430 [Aquisphaera giovannonii]
MDRDRGPLPVLGSLVLALGLLHLASAPAPAQDPGGKPRDEALDSLLEDLKKDEAKAPPAGPQSRKAEQAPAKGGGATKGGGGKTQDKPPGDGGPAGTKPAADAVSGKDKELDDLLEKLGESRDEPAAEERRPGGGGGGDREQPQPPGGGQGQGKDDRRKPGAGALEGKDKELDEKLEEFAGIKRKKKRGDDGGGSGSGPTSDIIKQMREVEQRLGKQEAGGETQSRQKEIVKRIDTLIEQARQSGSSGSRTIRMVRQQGQKPGGQEPGQEPGTNPGGAPAQKPSKPSDRHAMAGGKDIWGHLPPELRQEMENVFKEEALPTMSDMIKRYYVSVAKQKLVRGE